jgi:hypothetical protein
MFEDYIKVLMKMSVTNDGNLNRNVAYGIGVLAKRTEPATLFANHVGTALSMTKMMYAASEEQDAKDNCMMCMLKILDRFPNQFPQQEGQELFVKVMSSIPLTGDSSENETVVKFAGNLVAKGKQAEIMPYLDNLTATCLKIINDKNCNGPKTKVRAASFIKNIVMPAGE